MLVIASKSAKSRVPCRVLVLCDPYFDPRFSFSKKISSFVTIKSHDLGVTRLQSDLRSASFISLSEVQVFLRGVIA